MKLTLGISPCPNDTFIFDSFIKQAARHDLELEVFFEDVETLNQWAASGKLDVTKLSFPAFFKSLAYYELLNSGAALGKGVGPLLIAKKPTDPMQINNASVAIPGLHTTANFLLAFAFPHLQQKKAMLFSEIENAVLDGKVELGVIIHENRFTYQDKGLIKIADLGSIWEQKMQSPIPLGGIAIKRNLELSLKFKIEALIKDSIHIAFNNYPVISSFVKDHANEMDESVMRSHIDLYVNDYSIDLGTTGKNAIEAFYNVYTQSNSAGSANLFLE